jgi:RNA polymerase sigma-70 factor (sigma-E family)
VDIDADFGAFVQARQHAWLRAAYLVCGDLTEAEDLLQSALIKLARHWRKVRDDHPDAYLRQILYRDAVSTWRRRAAERRRAVLVATRPGPEANPLEAVDARIDLDRALRELTVKQRAVIVLRFFEDRSERETADALGVSVGTVKSQTHAALGRLRDLMPGLDLALTSEGGQR